MSTELICLIGLALWTLPLNHLPAIARVSTGGVKWAMGNRDTQPDIAPWVGRADRAQRNHLDNLPMIAAVILTTAVTQQTDAITAWAAIVLVAARLAHGLFYLAGIGILRSGAYFVSVLALGTIVYRLFV